MIDSSQYHQLRESLLQTPEILIEIEKKYMAFLVDAILMVIPSIVRDFDTAIPLLSFWINYPPIQRGHAPRGDSIPWQEVGETAIEHNVVRALLEKDSSIAFPGLPSGADLRFLTTNALVHFDIKVTGPNDRADEIVASPNQISGDGKFWKDGVINSPVTIHGARASMKFQPELPPFYVLEENSLICLTYFLKGVYRVESLGNQPLSHLELICVPNGLLCFDGPRYVDYKGLFIPGKDERDKDKKRTRVRMEPLSEIADWRRRLLWSY